ncbi:MAG: sulfatase-like hydrolase/transferase [Bacteroidia bacterium]|jgi:phosphoglycerol transferase MdoB-like AlkP superfamily enzyme
MNLFVYAIRLILFWLLFFCLQQILFIATGYDSYKGTIPELLQNFWIALPMNLAAGCYLVSIPLLLHMGTSFGLLPARTIQLNKIIALVFIGFNAILLCTDISLFSVWGTKLNSKALGYLKYPKELMPTVFTVHNTGLFLLIAFQILAGFWLLKKLNKPVSPPSESIWLRMILSVVILALLVVGFRGGIQRVPINRNRVFQSAHPVLNYAALNSFWNTADILTHPLEKQGNPYSFFELQTADSLTSALHHTQADSTPLILNTTRPNIVIIFLESWAGDIIESLGGEADVAPKFENLCKEGILFTHFYSTGYRTEQGFLATLSATPALPVGSVIHSFGKFDKLPNLYRELNGQGYQSSFYSGGRLFFDNIEAYLRAAGVQTMKGEDDWEIKRRTVWGAYDEEIFALHLHEMNQTPQPFFSALTTMTTHEWFDADVPEIFKGDRDPVNDRYRNTVHYSDSCLYAYIQEAKKQGWYKNTLFVIVADHSCKFPKNRNNYEMERHRIPMLILGGALKEDRQGQKFESIGSHTDIAATLLKQMGLQSTAFRFSKNLFNKNYNPFAYYAFDNGFGLITPDCDYLYDHNRLMITESHGSDSTLLNQWINYGKAYLQIQYQNNLDLPDRSRKE